MKASNIISALLLAALFLAPCALYAKKEKPKKKEQQSVEDVEREIRLMESQKKLKKAQRSATAVEIPCQEYDDEQWYVGTGKVRVIAEKLNTDEYTKLLKSCQQLLKTKIQGRYQAVVHDYFDQMDVDGQSNVASHIESAGQQIIDQYLNDTHETCREETEEGDDGWVTVYMNVKISKRSMADAVAGGIAKQMADKQLQTRFNEAKFRESALKVFEDKDAKANPSQEE